MSTPNGYDAMGKPVPKERMGAAYAAAKEMGLGTEDAMTLVGRMADRIERDDPYGALREATDAPLPRGVSSATRPHKPQPGARVDLTGGYRLLATLCTGP